MVKKLIKHEFIYYYRTLAILLPIIVLVGAVTRLFIFLTSLQHNVFELGGFAFFAAEAGLSSVMAIQMLGSIALLLFASAMGVVRFYKNMYTSEGYLTFTLPVNNHQHIFVKLLAMVTAQLASAVAVLLGAVIALSGEPLVLVIGSIGSAFRMLFENVPAIHTVFYIIEIFILAVIASVSTPLLCYACITIGQTAKKNRIFMAIGAYFLYYVARQVLASGLLIFSLYFVALGIFDWIGHFVTSHPFAALHIAFALAIIITSALAGLYYLITHRIMTKKLNLE